MAHQCTEIRRFHPLLSPRVDPCRFPEGEGFLAFEFPADFGGSNPSKGGPLAHWANVGPTLAPRDPALGQRGPTLAGPGLGRGPTWANARGPWATWANARGRGPTWANGTAASCPHRLRPSRPAANGRRCSCRGQRVANMVEFSRQCSLVQFPLRNCLRKRSEIAERQR